MEGRVGCAGSHAFSIHTPNIRGARSYQSMAGGSVATRCTSPSRAHDAAAVGDAAKGSVRRHLHRFRRFLRPLELRGWVERAHVRVRATVRACLFSLSCSDNQQEKGKGTEPAPVPFPTENVIRSTSFSHICLRSSDKCVASQLCFV